MMDGKEEDREEYRRFGKATRRSAAKDRRSMMAPSLRLSEPCERKQDGKRIGIRRQAQPGGRDRRD